MHVTRSVKSLAALILMVSAIASPAVAQTPSVVADADGYTTDDGATARAAYKRQVESVEFDTEGVSAQLISAAESAAGSPAAGGYEARAVRGSSALPGCYNHIVSSGSGNLQYGHICPGYGGFEGGQTAELFGTGQIVLRDPVTGQITGTIPADELRTGTTSTVTVSSALLAQFALADLTLPSPSIGMSPDGDQVVQLASWMWVDRAQWAPHDRTANAGPVSATVTAAPVRVEWDMGNGNVVTCNGPGRVYAPRFAGQPDATDCKYTYRHSSAGQAGESYDVTATVVWRASWTGSDGDGGALGELTSQTTESVRVAEVQALVQ